MKVLLTVVSLIFTTLISSAADRVSAEPLTLKNGQSVLTFHRCESGYGMTVVENGSVIARQDFPAHIIVKSMGKRRKEFKELEYSKEYEEITSVADSIVAIGRVVSDEGSVFRVRDVYAPMEDGAFRLNRTVTVEKSSEKDLGFASVVSLSGTAADGVSNNDFEYMLPAILYKDTCNLRRRTVASELSAPRVYVKETRMGIPMAMLRSKKSGNTFALVHHKPQISVANFVGGGHNWETNDSLKYGSLGFRTDDKISVDFRYPSAEGPATYEPDIKRNADGTVWSCRFHSVNKGNYHNYSLLIMPGQCGSYNDALVEMFRRAYMAEMPSVSKVCMDSVYAQNMHLFKSEYREFGTGAVKAAGMPWSLFLPDGECRDGYSFQMGFVGQQLPVGYHLYRYGLDNDDAESKRMGKTMVDFWTSEIFTGTYFPTVWWDPADNETAGRRREYPSFLRCMVDGMEGLLDACRIAEAYGEDHPQWRHALEQVVSHLVERQNEDGSFCRAYRTDGSVETGGDRNTFGESKLNTPLAVRLLVKMYEWSGDEKYSTAAIKAADYAYDELYCKLGKYVGGTPDNPNTVDKEAALYALHAFNAVHQLTGEEKYLKAAEHAANCAMSWVYCYDFAIPHRNAVEATINPFGNGGVRGFSLISTGHSGADNYMSYAFYEMFKLYVKTGNECYRHMASLLQNDTKLCNDFDGRMNYKYRSLMPEATNVADFAFRSVSVWLPWASIANIEPIVQLEETFGPTDLTSLDVPLNELRLRLDKYGSGGRPLIRNKKD